MSAKILVIQPRKSLSVCLTVVVLSVFISILPVVSANPHPDFEFEPVPISPSANAEKLKQIRKSETPILRKIAVFISLISFKVLKVFSCQK